jgi:glyoxylase-like metal-dependent hydrolase (beta-lactamase superfamily II)
MKLRSVIICWGIILGSFHGYSQERFRISSDLYYTEVKDSVYMITHHFPRYGSNSLFVLLPDEQGMLIDTPHESTGTRSLLDWINTSFGKLELAAINTGWHQDNLGGNDYLLSRVIPVYGPILTADLIRDRGQELKDMLLEQTASLEDKRYYYSYKELKLLPPDHTFPIEEGLQLEMGGETFEVYFPGESHTADNTVVYLHTKKILFGGCMIMSMRHRRPGFTDHANMAEWPGSVKKVQEKFPSGYWVIPGHGPPGGIELLEHTIQILEEFNKQSPAQ